VDRSTPLPPVSAVNTTHAASLAEEAEYYNELHMSEWWHAAPIQRSPHYPLCSRIDRLLVEFSQRGASKVLEVGSGSGLLGTLIIANLPASRIGVLISARSRSTSRSGAPDERPLFSWGMHAPPKVTLGWNTTR
jgi:hypothetical protein